jgi:predicted alpha/beta superfamily hydrolase
MGFFSELKQRKVAQVAAKIRLLALSLLLSANALPADSFDPSRLQGLGVTRYHAFDSGTLGHPLHIYVRVPESAAQNPGRRYATIYLLDGGINFPLLSSYYHYLRLGEELPELMLVGISYGSDTFDGGNFRSSDFTAPAEDREWWGNAPVFQSVLEQELMPMIEGEYPSDSGQRIIYGQSLGGQFVLYSALTRPDLFSGHIASNPALHRNLDFFLAWKGKDEMPRNATRLFVAEGELDDPRFRTPASKWIEYWSAPGRERPFELEVRMLPGHTHLSAGTESFRLGLQWLFPPGETGAVEENRSKGKK